MMKHAKYGLMMAALLLTSACGKSDTDMTEAYWCASYGTCKPGAETAAQVQPASAVADCSYYGTCNQQQAPAAYDACAMYGICDRGSL